MLPHTAPAAIPAPTSAVGPSGEADDQADAARLLRRVEHAHDAGQIVAAPKTTDISLARADRAAEGGVRIELCIEHFESYGEIESRCASTEDVTTSVGFDERELAVA